MKSIVFRGCVVLVLASVAVAAGCGSDPPAAPGCGPLTASGQAPAAAAGAGASPAKSNGAASGGLTVVFPSLYSAYDGTHSFQIPAKVVGAADATWTAEPADAVDIAAGRDGADVLLEVKRAGSVTITARAGDQWGTAVLAVTEADAQDWERGNARYAGSANPSTACTNCHGDRSGVDIEYTPMQTGGYSDDDLAAIFTQAKKPDGAKMRVMPADQWAQIHRWDLTAEEVKGLVVYLRSLAPRSHGDSDWGGR